MNLLSTILDALFDTFKVFVVVFIIYIIFSFIEGKITKSFENKKKFSPLIGASIGLIPQCGFSIVTADLYKKKYVTLGTLIAVFIACSDEAIPIILSYPNKIYLIIPLLATKFIIAILSGYIIDFIAYKQEIKKHDNLNKIQIHSGCCHHDIEDHDEESKIKKHLLHPLIHSLKISFYVLIVNLIFALIIYFLGENTIKNFLNQNIYLTPLFASIVGLIPNCATSVIITELFVTSSLSFGATIAGLCCNAGFGLIFLFKGKEISFKKVIAISFLLFAISQLFGYFILMIELLF